MFKRLKRALVDSYIGAIALGYLLAEVVLHFVAIFALPVANWAGQKAVLSWAPISRSEAPPRLQFQDALPELLNFLLLLVFWYILLRWLYLESPKKETP
jgi:uncharacterized membrane protein YccF (DUF307 family)